MKKKFENIDDFTRTKINCINDDDIEINGSLIWKKIEHRLDEKNKISFFAWPRLAAVACLLLLIGRSIFMINQPQETVAVRKEAQKVIVKTSPKNIEKEIKNFPQKFDNKVITSKKNKTKTTENKKLEINLELILKPNTEIITQTAPTFKPIEMLPILPQFPPKTITKMRVMHISDYQSAVPEVFMKPKTFYFQYAQTDIQQIINNQTPAILYSRSNIQN